MWIFIMHYNLVGSNEIDHLLEAEPEFEVMLWNPQLILVTGFTIEYLYLIYRIS